MVPINAVIRRINQKLAAKGEILKANHRYRYYYILDMNMNVVSKDIDPKKTHAQAWCDDGFGRSEGLGLSALAQAKGWRAQLLYDCCLRLASVTP